MNSKQAIDRLYPEQASDLRVTFRAQYPDEALLRLVLSYAGRLGTPAASGLHVIIERMPESDHVVHLCSRSPIPGVVVERDPDAFLAVCNAFARFGALASNLYGSGFLPRPQSRSN